MFQCVVSSDNQKSILTYIGLSTLIHILIHICRPFMIFLFIRTILADEVIHNFVHMWIRLMWIILFFIVFHINSYPHCVDLGITINLEAHLDNVFIIQHFIDVNNERIIYSEKCMSEK